MITTHLDKVSNIQFLEAGPEIDFNICPTGNLSLASVAAFKSKEIAKRTTAAAEEASERISAASLTVLAEGLFASAVIDLSLLRV